uniref:Fibroblast growth factor n=1 Tax=Ursus maritimus TaxID=29073 RepID=A0A452TF65_URSMA
MGSTAVTRLAGAQAVPCLLWLGFLQLDLTRALPAPSFQLGCGSQKAGPSPLTSSHLAGLNTRVSGRWAAGIIEIRSIRVGVVALKAVHTGFYVAMNRRGHLYGSVSAACGLSGGWGSTEAPERPHPGWSLKDMAVWSPEGLGRSLGKGSEAGAHWGVDAGRRWERLGQSEV